MNGTSEAAVIKGETVERTVYKCPECGTGHQSEEEAKICYAMYTFLVLMKKIYMEEAGGFLLKGEEVIDVLRVSTFDRESCIDSYVKIKLVSSHDSCIVNRDNVRDWLEAGVRNISLAKAVELGWRAAFNHVWEEKATPEMDAEYRAAIDQVISRLTPERKQQLLQEALMFPQMVNGKPRLD